MAAFVDYLRMMLGWKGSPSGEIVEYLTIVGTENSHLKMIGTDNNSLEIVGTEDDSLELVGV